MNYKIEHSNGRVDSGYETLADAIAQLRSDYDHIADLKIDSDEDGTIARDPSDDADHSYLARVVKLAKNTIVRLKAAPYGWYDDCLAAATADYIDDHPDLKGYDLDARWEDDERDAILLTVPDWSVAS